MADQKVKKKRGAPPKYKPEYCQMIIEAGKKGKTFGMFASSINVHADSLLEWAHKYKEFSVARKRAKQEMENYFVGIGMAGMLGKTKNLEGEVVMPKFNGNVWEFMMKARFGWRENDQPEQEEIDLEFT